MRTYPFDYDRKICMKGPNWHWEQEQIVALILERVEER
jgi:hypothetical protein